jgi:SAM-dependent methyltransferase
MSSDSPRERWNEKYRSSPQIWIEPDAFLPWAFRKFVEPAFPNAGRALDFAGGAGRHALWLAQQGWDVTLIDISEAGVELARQKAGWLAPRLHCVVDDLTGFRASQTRFDLVMVFNYLDRGVFPEIVQSLRPGGLLLYKTHTVEQLKLAGGPKDAAYLLEPGELARLASGLQILWEHEEVSEKATAEIVAKREVK